MFCVWLDLTGLSYKNPSRLRVDVKESELVARGDAELQGGADAGHQEQGRGGRSEENWTQQPLSFNDELSTRYTLIPIFTILINIQLRILFFK